MIGVNKYKVMYILNKALHQMLIYKGLVWYLKAPTAHCLKTVRRINRLMPFQKQSQSAKGAGGSVREGAKDPLLEHVKRKFKRAARGIGIAGMVGLSALMARPTTLTAQEVATQFSKGTGTEQSEGKKILNCYLDLGTMMNYFTPEESEKNNRLFETMFNSFEKNESGIISGTDTIKGFVWEKVIDVSKGVKKTICEGYGISGDEYEKGVTKGAIFMKRYSLDSEKLDLNMFIVNKNGIDKRYNEGSKIELTFEYDSNYYFSAIKMPKEYALLDVKPFFGRKTKKDTQFGIYMRYKQDGKIYEMINLIIYNNAEKKAMTYYILRGKNDNGMISMLEEYK